MSPKPLLVLFVSTGNAARSIVAEAVLNAKGSQAYRARSAGVGPLPVAIDADAKFLLESAGYDTQKLHPKTLEDFYQYAGLVKVDVIVTLSEEAREICPLDWPGSPVRVHWTVDDPSNARRPEIKEWKLRKCLSTLETRINMLVRSRPNMTSFELLLQLKDIGMVV